MSKLPTRFVLAILAIGILVGAATSTTVISGGLKSSNLAQAQIPVQQAVAPAVSSAAPPSSTGAPFGPNCVGCVTTQNLANDAVTTQKIAPGAVSLSVTQAFGPFVTVTPGNLAVSIATCPSGTVVTGGGFEGPSSRPTELRFSGENNANGWNIVGMNTGSTPYDFQTIATCISIHP